MDLQSFCAESRKKVHSFPYLRSSVHSKDKMSKSFQFGVPVRNTIMEENCLQNIHNMSCNAQFAFQGITKSQDCQQKKSCFDQLNKFSPFSFSRVVGGFVGSKSQGGSASREPHQVWDVIFRQLVDTACEATMNNNTQQYFSIGEAVSQSIFGHFNNCKNSSLGFSSYIFAKPCNSFESKGTTGNMQGSNDNPSASDANCKDKGQLNKVLSNSQLHSVNVESSARETVPNMSQSTSKQSYADVAKAFIAARRDIMCSAEGHQALSQRNKSTVLRQSRRENERFNSKSSRQHSTCYTQPSYNNSSQNQQHKKHTILLEKCDDKVPSKFIRDKYEHTRHVNSENSHLSKQRTKVDRGQQNASVKERSPEDRKSRYGKFRGRNMREKERKSIGLQVQEESIYACNMSEQNCQNWRCDHNRNFKICKTDSCDPKEEYKSKKYKQQSRLRSPPPRTFVRDVIEKSESKTNDNYSIKNVKKDPAVEKMCEETLCNIEKSTPCSSWNLSKTDDSSESSVSSISTNHAIVLPQRPRVASECSIDSEDSYVVFERDDHDLVDEDTNDDVDSDSCSDCDSEEDCDEVDFCYFIPSEDISSSNTEKICTDAFSPVPERLKDINKKWQEEISLLPKVERIPKKVHFPNANDLVKVHHMIYWTFAYREARRGHWEEIGRDRCRFRSRIERAERDLSSVLNPEHRRRIWEERMSGVQEM